MIEFPAGELERHFNGLFLPGSIWFFKNFYFPETDETRSKYLVVLNPQCTDDNCYFLLATSKVEKALGNRLIAADTVVIEPGIVRCFTRPTALKVSSIHAMKYDEMKRLYVHADFKDRMEHKGRLPAVLMDEVRERFVNSRRVPMKQKRLVFPG